MKQHLSVFMLYIRSSIYKVLLLLLGMAVMEGVLFWWTLNNYLKEAAALTENGIGELFGMGAPLTLEAVFENSYVVYAFIAFALLITVVLCLIGCERGNKQGYTLRRLSISESSVVLWQSLCNICCYLLLWVVQIFIVWGLCQFYVGTMEAAISNQTIFLAFYRNTFLHNLLPLDEVSVWVRNIFLIVCFGMTTACFSFRQRRGKFAAEVLALFWATIVWCSRDIGAIVIDIFAIGCCIMVIGVELYRIFAKEVPDEA